VAVLAAGQGLAVLELATFVQDFTGALKIVDSRRPECISRSGRVYLPGIGPHSEDRAVDLIVNELKQGSPSCYASLRCRVPYPKSRQTCDLVLGEPAVWRIEVKMARLVGDNGKPDDTAIKDVLSPFDVDRSAVADVAKLAANSVDASNAILIYGFDALGKPVDQLMEAFEAVAARRALLGPRHTARFSGLVHPAHRDGGVFAWEVLGRVTAKGKD